MMVTDKDLYEHDPYEAKEMTEKSEFYIDDLNFLIDRKAERIRSLEAELAEAKNYLCGFLWFLDEGALIRDISNDAQPDFYIGASRFAAWISRAVKASGRG